MNSPLPFVPTGCKNLSGMTAPVGLLGRFADGAVWLGLKYRALRASAGDLSTALSRRETELLEARESLHRIAAIDPITSLANHSAFREFLQAEWRRALREASCISVLLVDIDYFRDYNDRLGHQAGDESLARIGSTLKGIVQRPGDLVARYGGGEFAVVMSRTDPQGASLVVYRICAAVEALAMKHPPSRRSHPA
ncbi:MAG: diguanylate cyclase [Vicinamibacterales bacterium]|nr:diguanylate cyclase [Vicinamibacterales bacterium]